MAIKLRVISEQYRELGENRSRVFGVNGGTVGRAPGNDWVLPDPRRVVSGHHFEVQFHGGKYWLIDTSTNGVFVNDADDPASDTGRIELNDGDRLRVGDYDILVSLDNRIDFLPTSGDEQSAAKHLDSDIGHSLNFDNLFTPRETSDERLAPDRQRVRRAPERRVACGTARDAAAHRGICRREFVRSDVARAGSIPSCQAWSRPMQARPSLRHRRSRRRRNRLPATRTGHCGRARLRAKNSRTRWRDARRRVDARERSLPFHQQASTWADLRSAVQAFCRGAGIDQATLSPEAQAMLPLVAGQLLREAVVGLNDILRARATGAAAAAVAAAADGTGQQQQPSPFVDEHRAGPAASLRIARTTLCGPGRLVARRAAGHA